MTVTSVPIRIDQARALELLRKVVADAGPDHVYTGPRTAKGEPRYIDIDGAGSCLVGRALLLAGVPVHELERREGKCVWPLRRWLHVGGVAWISDPAARAFARAQRAQDDGQPWGEALAAAGAKPIARANPAPHHIDTAQGGAEALAALQAVEDDMGLPHPVEAHPVPAMGRLDVHLPTVAALADWAAALETPIVDHAPVYETVAVLDGHVVDLWALAGTVATP